VGSSKYAYFSKKLVDSIREGPLKIPLRMSGRKLLDFGTWNNGRGQTYPFFEDIISYPYTGPQKGYYILSLSRQKKIWIYIYPYMGGRFYSGGGGVSHFRGGSKIGQPHF
jgi:hypothetical protein